MSTYTLYYATNRNHKGERWAPTQYGTHFSADGTENLRFGKVSVKADKRRVEELLSKPMKDCGTGDGEKLSGYLTKCAEKAASIAAYEEKIKKEIAETAQKNAKLGSRAMFAELQEVMQKSSDVLIFIHGFNVSWHDAVGSALALQSMLNREAAPDAKQVTVVLFTWPSDGLALPLVSYKSDRSEAKVSGRAIGRGFLKLRDFLMELRDRAVEGGAELCGQQLHLLCHSMGNYVLQNALPRVDDFTPGSALPRLFEHIFLCAPDVDDTVLEPGAPLGRVHEIARNVTVYHNRSDTAMYISDYTKGHPDRLGGTGAARPFLLHSKVHQVDCSPIVHGIVEHSYYLSGSVNADIGMSIHGKAFADAERLRRQVSNAGNVWIMEKE
jgi:esterase/lipase superfamily enzyme